MRLLKWLFHPMIVFVIVVLIAVYLNRQTFFPELSESPEVKQITSRVDSVIEKMNETMSSLSQEQQRPSQAQPSQVDAEQSATSEDESEREVSTIPEVATIAEPDTPQTEPEQRATQAAVAKENTDEETAPEVSAPVAASSDEAATTSSNIEEPQGVPPAPSAANKLQRSDPHGLWDDARRAAWKGNTTVAIEKYHALIAMQPDNFDAYGELGNVFLHKGDPASAVDAYYQAAMLLSKSHYSQAAWRVLGIVSRLDPRKGQVLYEAMRRQQLDAAQPQTTVK